MSTTTNSMSNTIQRAAASRAPATRPGAPMAPAGRNPSTILSSIMDSEGYRKRFDEILGKRAPQFISSIISLVNATPELQNHKVEMPPAVQPGPSCH